MQLSWKCYSPFKNGQNGKIQSLQDHAVLTLQFAWWTVFMIEYLVKPAGHIKKKKKKKSVYKVSVWNQTRFLGWNNQNIKVTQLELDRLKHKLR